MHESSCMRRVAREDDWPWWWVRMEIAEGVHRKANIGLRRKTKIGFLGEDFGGCRLEVGGLQRFFRREPLEEEFLQGDRGVFDGSGRKEESIPFGGGTKGESLGVFFSSLSTCQKKGGGFEPKR